MRRFELIVLCVVLAACGDTIYELPELPPGASGKTDTPVFDGDGRLINPRGDSDGDGITDREELDGWTLTVDTDGWAVLALGTESYQELIEVRHVSSDPRYADTDGDGLLDGQERTVKSDPRRIDTDGDTLSDADEIGRWGTSPSSVDTDGDARGGDPAKPRPPLFQLFDAGELRLVKDPADPTGPLIPGPGATAPYLPDTDGDGNGDYSELLGGTVRATVAEVGKLSVVPTPGAQMDLYFNVTSTSSSTTTKAYGKTTSFAEEGFMRHRSALTTAIIQKGYFGTYVDQTATVGCCLDALSIKIDTGLTSELETRAETTVSFQDELGGGFDTNTVLNDVQTDENEQLITIDGGTIRVPVDVINSGPIPYRLEDLVLSVSHFDRRAGKYVPVVEIPAAPTSLAPGERRTLYLASSVVPVDAMKDLMADPDSIMIAAKRFSLQDQDGVDLDFMMADVLANTVQITLDFATHTDRYFVAANAEVARGTTVGQALREAGVELEALPIDRDGTLGVEGYYITINGIGTILHQGVADPLDERLPYPEGEGPGPRLISHGWYAAITHFDGSAPTYDENLFDVRVYQGDEVTLIYSEDLDRDGVPSVVEEMRGSSDMLTHSDGTAASPEGDGLSDYWETRVGWVVEWPGRAPYHVYSSPASIDSDNDGLRDDEEALLGTDPWMIDTDEDGYPDLFERDDAVYGLDPLLPVGALAKPVVSCSLTQEWHGTHWEGPAQCVVIANEDTFAFDLPAVVVPCSEFTKVGVVYRSNVLFGTYPQEGTGEPGYYTDVVEIDAWAMEAMPGYNLHPDQFGVGNSYFEPVGRSAVCNALVRYDSNQRDYVRVPCWAFTDTPGGEVGRCESIRPCPGGGRDACWEDALDEAGWHHPPEEMPSWSNDKGPLCASVVPEFDEPDWYYTLHVVATDAQEDLRGVVLTFDEVQGSMLYQPEFAELADCGGCPPTVIGGDRLEVTQSFEACHDPASIKAEAYDALGLRSPQLTCTWAEGSSCVEP